MKKQIRQEVFETNSSSSHSLTLNTEDFVMDTSLVPQNGVVKIIRADGEFGWEWFKENDAYTKALYAIIDGCEDLVESAIRRQLGAELEVIKDYGNGSFGYYDGYIDHDSHGNVRESVTTVDDMIHFIFNKNSWLFGGNDNSEPSFDFYMVPKYNTDGTIDEVIMDHKFSIDGILTVRVPKNLTKEVIESIISGEFDYFKPLKIDGREYSSYDFDINMSEQTITFKAEYDSTLDDDSVKQLGWSDRREHLKQYDKTVYYEISKW